MKRPRSGCIPIAPRKAVAHGLRVLSLHTRNLHSRDVNAQDPWALDRLRRRISALPTWPWHTSHRSRTLQQGEEAVTRIRRTKCFSSHACRHVTKRPQSLNGPQKGGLARGPPRRAVLRGRSPRGHSSPRPGPWPWRQIRRSICKCKGKSSKKSRIQSKLTRYSGNRT